MTVGRVVGNVVCTPVHQALQGIKLLLVQKIVDGKAAGVAVAADSLGTSGPGNLVYMIKSSEAAASLRRGPVPVDLAIVGIVSGYNSVRGRLEV